MFRTPKEPCPAFLKAILRHLQYEPPGRPHAIVYDRLSMDASSSATKADLALLRKEMDKRFTQVDERFDRVHDDIGRVLNVVINIEKSLTFKVTDHERRITTLEKTAA